MDFGYYKINEVLTDIEIAGRIFVLEKTMA